MHHAGRQRPAQTERVAEGHDEGADTQGIGVAQGGRSRPAMRNAKERKVRATIGDDEMRVDLPFVGEPDAKARSARDMGVRHDEVGRPQDARTASARAVDLDCYLLEPVGDPGEVRWQGLKRGKDAHRRLPGAHEARRPAGCSS